MDDMVENDTRETHWELSRDDSDRLLDFLFPDEVLFPKGMGELAQKSDHYAMEQVLNHCIDKGLYLQMVKPTSGSSEEKAVGYWPGAPQLDAKPTAREGLLAAFFNLVVGAVNQACAMVSIRVWSADSATRPLSGGDAMRKPDLSCWLAPGSKFDWRHLATFAEVKNCTGKDNERSSGSFSTCGYDINHNPREFLRILIGVTSAPRNILGFDTSISWGKRSCEDGKVVDMKELKIEMDAATCTIELKRLLFISDNLFGRGTTVWEGMMRARGTGGMQARKVAMKDSWIDPLRKYTEGKILSILDAYKVKGIPMLVHKEQVKVPYPSVIEGLQLNGSTHFLQAYLAHYKTNPYYLRVLSRIVTHPVGDLITDFSCLGELLVAFLDYIVAHKNAVEIARVLHCDISLFNLLLASVTQRSDHSEFVQRMSSLSAADQTALCTRIASVKRRGVLADWGYAVPMAEPTTITGSVTPTPPVEQPTQAEYESSNSVPVVPVNSKDVLRLVSDLTKEDNIVLAMGPASVENDLRHTIDTSPLHRTGTWSWMAAQLVMAGAGQPVVHDATHDLESFFYVLIGICVLLNEPYKPKCDNLTQCFDKYFNTFEPSVLKTITIRSDLTWKPFILQHISDYFKPIINLLTHLCNTIIVPLSADGHGNVDRKTPFTHDMFIAAIIQMLSELGPDAWTAVSQAGNDDEVGSETEIGGENSLKLVDVESEVDASPDDSADESSNGGKVFPSNLPFLLPRPAPHRRSAGPGFYSLDSGLALGSHAHQERRNDLDPPEVPNKRRRSSSRGDSPTSSLPSRGASVLRNRRGYSTGSMHQRATHNSMCK
ncbi:hypothetical protein EDD15DRAFT_2369663 [Pisolithus albus]|nr:hypothetical protein EDD15DRAFT_2369663 [Pisolithus albus]